MPNEAAAKTASESLMNTPEHPEWSAFFSSKTPKMAMFVFKFSHCLHGNLSHCCKIGELHADVPAAITNCKNSRHEAEQLGIRCECIPINKQNKLKQDAKEIALLEPSAVDSIHLARCMQILSPSFADVHPNQLINTHHSFLPAFPSAKLHHRAHQKGVQIVGATGHHVTSDLDQGPILFQDVVNVTHRDAIPDSIPKGRDAKKVCWQKRLCASGTSHFDSPKQKCHLPTITKAVVSHI